MRFAASILVLSSAALAACQTPQEQASAQVAAAAIMDRSGEQIGTARFYSQANEVTLAISLSGLSEGARAVHLHTKGDCSTADFTSASGHLNPHGKEHGSLNPAGQHLGDLPNIVIGANGTGSIGAVLQGPAPDVLADIFDDDGTAIIVHEGVDDYRTDPTGAAGGRIACGLVARV